MWSEKKVVCRERGLKRRVVSRERGLKRGLVSRDRGLKREWSPVSVVSKEGGLS